MSTINLATIPSNVPSLCIPRVFMNIGEKRIRDVFAELNLGTIERVDMIEKKSEKGEKFKRVFVHFRNWNNNSNEREARDRLLTGNEIKIIYDEPWFWKVSALRTESSDVPARQRQEPEQQERRPRSGAIVEDPRLRRPLPRGPTRTISAEMCNAYDYGPNGEMVPYSELSKYQNKKAATNFIRKLKTETEHEKCIQAYPHSNPMGFPDEDCDCCFCQR